MKTRIAAKLLWVVALMQIVGCGSEAEDVSKVSVTVNDVFIAVDTDLVPTRIDCVVGLDSNTASEMKVAARQETPYGTNIYLLYDDGTHGDEIAGDNTYSYVLNTRVDDAYYVEREQVWHFIVAGPNVRMLHHRVVPYDHVKTQNP